MKFTEKLIQDMTAGIFKNGLVVSTSSDGQCEYMTLDDDMKKHYYDSCMQTTNKNKLLKQFCENNNIKIIKKFHPAIDSQENEKEYYKNVCRESEEVMKKFRVEMTEAVNGYCFTGEWDSDFCPDDIEAETEEEAIEFAKDYFVEQCINIGNDDIDVEDYIFRAKEID